MREKRALKSKKKNLPSFPHLFVSLPVLPEREAPAGVEHRAALHPRAPALIVQAAAAPSRALGVEVEAVSGGGAVLVALATNRDNPDRESRLAAAAPGPAPAARGCRLEAAPHAGVAL